MVEIGRLKVKQFDLSVFSAGIYDVQKLSLINKYFKYDR